MLRSSVTFGHGSSYYARSPQAARWHDIPSDLENEIREKTVHSDDSAPDSVALGKDGAWVAVWPDGTCNWNLGKNYIAVHKALREEGHKGISVRRKISPSFPAQEPLKLTCFPSIYP